MTETPEAGEIDLDNMTLMGSHLAVTGHLRAITGPATGQLTRREADTLLRSYLEPRGFSEAVRRLATRHLLILVGEHDTGRRLGALALLSRMSLAVSTITVLSPAAGAADLLTGTEYKPGRAYLLHDWITAGTDRTELVNLARKLAELGSYLVITRSGGPSQAVEVEHAWAAPEPGELFDLCLRAYGRRAGLRPDELTRARELARTLPTPAEVVRLAARLSPGGEPAGEEVTAWLDTKPPMREVLAVAALAFTHRLAEPAFGEQLARLERLCQEIGHRPAGGPLIGVEDGLVTFRAPHQRARVLAELVARYGFGLWQPLREWVRSLPGQGPAVQVRAAEGVALLARHSMKEARQEFLEVWARGSAAERVAAANVLSYLCADDTLAPEALGIALGWAADPHDIRATAAAVALGGGLSVRYPDDCARVLRRLETLGGPAAAVAAQSLKSLPAR
ncbi:unnamed protein product [[Actinomadura] parvosata subsp. kistnae]|uniref:Uncharacterized protein n=1 Tax=[Actinomadura] parvosata subsp. kistnae TaxID=1909395 RepID=A0A1V0ADU2_9ACTN|nr:hypothetical protein [Nonomuraea sp. ATCC 55076]AQZ68353.1 hypothetical protein BKM31_48985 [Nonomuraea sp. ATCC 55076]SPL93213.1 unnamed protein product [Actinomadura parvosata subsp. kistnae]